MDAVQVLQKKIWNINIKPVFLSGDELDKEIQRSEAMTKIADQIIKNGDLQFKAMKHMEKKPERSGKDSNLCTGVYGKNITDRYRKEKWSVSLTGIRITAI